MAHYYNMNTKFKALIILLAGAVLISGLYSIVGLIIIKYKGSKIAAIVLKVDTDCDRYNEITVAYEGKNYPVTISRANCQDKVYKVGQSVILIKYKDYNTLIWPEVNYEWLPFVFIVLFVLAYYTNKEKFQKHKRSKPKTVSPKKQL